MRVMVLPPTEWSLAMMEAMGRFNDELHTALEDSP